MNSVYKDKIRALSLFFSSKCNMNCSYCYIHNKKDIVNYQKDIVEWISSGRYIKDIHEIFSNKIYDLGFWGAEPLYTLSYCDAEKLIYSFPELNSIYMSTNLYEDSNIILDFIKNLNKSKRYLKFSIQISIDGNEDLNSISRGKGYTKIIEDNLNKLSYGLNSIDLCFDVDIFSGNTIHTSCLEYLQDNSNKQIEYLDNINNKLKDINKNKRVKYVFEFSNKSSTGIGISIEDGKKYANIQKSLMNQDLNYIRVLRRFDIFKLFKSSSTCSAGRAHFGLTHNRTMHLCHRTFGMEQEHIKKFIFNENEIDKLCFIGEQYHSSLDERINMSRSIIKEMSENGEISEIYKKDFAAYILARFINVSAYCPLDNIVLCGSPFISPPDVYRLYGNGALETHIRMNFEQWI